jgi:hypothetical protein
MEVSGQFHAPSDLPPRVRMPRTQPHTILLLWKREKPFYPFRESNPEFLGRPARRLVTIPTELSWLLFKKRNGTEISFGAILPQEISRISAAVSEKIYYYYYYTLKFLNALNYFTECNVITGQEDAGN